VRDDNAPRTMHHFPEACLVDAPVLQHAGAATIWAAAASIIATHAGTLQVCLGWPPPLTTQLFRDVLVRVWVPSLKRAVLSFMSIPPSQAQQKQKNTNKNVPNSGSEER
jgi:hypothetical protein